MKTKTRLSPIGLVAISLFLIFMASSAQAVAVADSTSTGPYAYITNYDSSTVTVVDTETYSTVATVNVGMEPLGVAVTPDEKKVYVANGRDASVSVIDTTNNNVTATVNVGYTPFGVAVNKAGTKVYITNMGSNTVSVIDTTTNIVIAIINVGNSPSGISVTPDETKVYVANYGDGTVSVIDTETNTVTATMTVGINPWGIAVTPDGANVYVANVISNNISVINTSTDTVTATLNVGHRPIGVAVNPAGTKAYVANSGGNTVSVIDAETNTITSTVIVGNRPYGVSVTPDGTKLFALNSDGTASVIDTTTDEVVATIGIGSMSMCIGQFIVQSQPPIPPVSEKQFAYITNAGVDSKISVIDTSNDTVTKTIVLSETTQYWPFGVAANKAGTRVYVTNSYQNSVSVIDTASNTVTATVPVENWPFGVAVTPDGNKVYVANLNSNTVSVVDTAINTVIATVSVGINPRGVAVSPGGTKVYVTNTGSNTVSIIDTATDNVTATVNLGNNIHEGQPWGIAVAPDGLRVYVANFGGYYDYDTVSVIDTTNNSVVATVDVGVWPEGVAINPAGTRVYVSNTESDTISVIDMATNLVIATVPVGDYPHGISVTPDGKKVYVGNVNNNTVSVIDAETNSVTATVSVGNNPYAFGQFICSPPNVEPVFPVANFTSSVTEGYSPLSVQFIDLSENATEWSWNFGDGETSTEQNVTHTYSTSGEYIVSLTVSNAGGMSSTSNEIITVQAEPVYYSGNNHYYELKNVPGGITWDDAKNAARSLMFSGMNGHLATITSKDESDFVVDKLDLTYNWIGGFQPDGSEEPAGGWQWVTGEPWSYTNWPSDEPNNAGLTENKLHIWDNGLWNDDSDYKLLDGYIVEYEVTNYTIPELPAANFSTNTTTGNIPLSVQFYDSSENAVQWYWDFGDGSNSIEKDPIHTYSTEGNYTVTLTAYNLAGSDVMTKPDYVVASRHDDIIWGIAPLTLLFTDLSDDATYWKWNFGDGTNSTEQNPKHTYTKAGQYAVSVTVNNTAGVNSATYTGYVNVVNSLEPPVAAFSASPTYGKLPLNVSFTDSSSGSPTSWKWYFGDGTNSTEQNPTHLYAKAGQYAVTLSVSNVAGSNSITKLNYISVGNSLKAPVNAFSVSII